MLRGSPRQVEPLANLLSFPMASHMEQHMLLLRQKRIRYHQEAMIRQVVPLELWQEVGVEAEEEMTSIAS